MHLLVIQTISGRYIILYSSGSRTNSSLEVQLNDHIYRISQLGGGWCTMGDIWENFISNNHWALFETGSKGASFIKASASYIGDLLAG